MNRRRYLSAVGGTVTTLLAGCVSDDTGEANGDDSGNDEATDTPTPGDDSDESAKFAVEPVSVGDDRPFSYSATVATNQFDTSAGPLSVRIELTNSTDELLTYAEARAAMFEGEKSDEGPFALYPGTSDDIDRELYAFDETCWQRTDGYLVTSDYQTGELEPGDSVGRTLVLTVTPGEPCPETVPREIPFSTEIKVWEGDQQIDLEGGTDYEWGFTLTRE